MRDVPGAFALHTATRRLARWTIAGSQVRERCSGPEYAAGRHGDNVTFDYAPFAAYTRGSPEATVTQRYAASAGSAEGIARAPDGTLWVAGLFYGSIDVGSGPVESPSTSGFVLRVLPP
ncbi:hypothetical protein [Sorangium sp. So ce406]|uniref:hypothetical protein n=1 Tax=Sorangium sp. So ce406 TaxID=3133311 RepID=UPI003F5C82A5